MKTRLRKFFLPVMYLLVSYSVFGQDFAFPDYKQISVRKEADGTVNEFSSPAMGKLEISYGENPTTRELDMIRVALSVFKGWNGLELTSLRIIVGDGNLNVYVQPKRYMYDGADVSAYMPSGMFFIISDLFEYDFRMKVGNIFLRMKGIYIDSGEVGKKIASAIRDPYAFIRLNDPEFMIRKSEDYDRMFEENNLKFSTFQKEQNGRVTGVESELDDLRAETAVRNEELEQAGLNLLDGLAREGETRLNGLREDTETGLENLRKDTATLLDEMKKDSDAEIAGLKKENAALREELRLLRDSVVMLHNRGFFGGIDIPDAKAVARTIELVKATPSMTVREINDALKAEKLSLDPNELFLLLAVYFGRYGN